MEFLDEDEPSCTKAFASGRSGGHLAYRQNGGGFLTKLPAEGRDCRRITRADVLRGVAEGLPHALVAGYVWGTGASAFLVGRRARVFRDCLRSAADELRSRNTSEPMNRCCGTTRTASSTSAVVVRQVPHAADAQGDRPGRALILDRFVAIALTDRGGWDISGAGPWDPSTYERWLDHAHQIAAVEGPVPTPWRWPTSATAEASSRSSKRLGCRRLGPPAPWTLSATPTTWLRSPTRVNRQG